MDTLAHLAQRFLRLAADDNGAFDRLGRCETALWREICHSAFMLDVLRRQGFGATWVPRSSHPGRSKSCALPVLPKRCADTDEHVRAMRGPSAPSGRLRGR
jgi:hypothetical protein